jgi:hypothetical protein
LIVKAGRKTLSAGQPSTLDRAHRVGHVGLA